MDGETDGKTDRQMEESRTDGITLSVSCVAFECRCKCWLL